MSADLERLAREFKGDKFKHLRASLNANAQIARQLGAPEHFENGQAAASPTAERASTNLLDQAIDEYKNGPRTPELITQVHQTIWQARGEIVGATYEVTPSPYTHEQLTDIEANGKRVGYLPAELATQQARHKLGEMFPKMQSHSVQEGNSVTNDENPSGWFDYEVAIDTPYLDTKEKELMDRIKKDGRRILTLNEYIVAGQDSELFTGKYLDETSTWVRLGSRFGGRMVNAGFGGGGRLGVVSDLHPDYHYSHLGGRSSGVNKS